MKLTAAFLAAALAVSVVLGLPITDSDTHIIAARSDFKLDGAAMLQNAKRGTDTDLLTRQFHHAGDAQQSLLNRDIGELQDGAGTQRNALSKRAPVNLVGGIKDAEGYVHDLSNATSSHSVDLSDTGALEVSDSGAGSSTPASEQLATSPHKSAAGYTTDHYGGKMTADEAKYQRDVHTHTWEALAHVWGKDTQNTFAKEAISQHYHLHHRYGNAYAEAQGGKLLSGDMKEEEEANAFLDKLKITPATTREELLHHKERESTTVDTLSKYTSRYDLTNEKLSVGKKQTENQIAIIDHHLKRFS